MLVRRMVHDVESWLEKSQLMLVEILKSKRNLAGSQKYILSKSWWRLVPACHRMSQQRLESDRFTGTKFTRARQGIISGVEVTIESKGRRYFGAGLYGSCRCHNRFKSQ